MKIVAVCSGGLDSTIMYYHLKSANHEVIPINFNYGSKHNEMEREAGKRVLPGLRSFEIDLSFLHSSLLKGGVEIPHGHYQAQNMRSTVVPFRNGIMLSYAVALAEDIEADAVALGAHAGDHAIYPDCREEFLKAFDTTAQAGTYQRIKLLAPFWNFSKAEIVKRGAELGILNEMAETWSCYEGGTSHCGKCGTCIERHEAFVLAGVDDQTTYQK